LVISKKSAGLIVLKNIVNLFVVVRTL